MGPMNIGRIPKCESGRGAEYSCESGVCVEAKHPERPSFPFTLPLPVRPAEETRTPERAPL